MYGKIKIGETETGFLANASTPFRFKNVFNIDLIAVLAKGDEGAVDDYERLAFIMAKQAEKADLSTLTDEDFYQWLEQYEFDDLIEAIPAVVGLYMRNKQTNSGPK